MTTQVNKVTNVALLDTLVQHYGSTEVVRKIKEQQEKDALSMANTLTLDTFDIQHQ